MLEGVKPRPEPLLLRRVILNTIPRFGAPPAPAAVRLHKRMCVCVHCLID